MQADEKGKKGGRGGGQPTYKAVEHGTGDPARQSHGCFQRRSPGWGQARGIASLCLFGRERLRQASAERLNVPERARASLSLPEMGAGALAASAAVDNGGEGKLGGGAEGKEGGRLTPPLSSGSETRLCHAKDFPKASKENGVFGSACQEKSQRGLCCSHLPAWLGYRTQHKGPCGACPSE